MTVTMERVEEMTLNVEGIRSVVRAIEHDLGGWDQGRFLGTGECGTTRCLAGWAIHLAGLDLAEMLRPPGGSEDVIELARRLLGLTVEQADELFLVFGVGSESPTLGELKAKITAVTGVTFD